MVMKSLVLTIVLMAFFFSQDLAAGSPAVEWTKIIGGAGTDGGECVVQTSNGDFIIAGITESYGSGGYDIYLIRTDSSGDTIWSQTFGGADDDEGHSVQQTTDGGFVIAGNTESYGAGSDDIYIIKTNSSGTAQWIKVFGGYYSEIGNSIIQTSSGGYIVAGFTASFGAGGRDVYLVRTNSDGNLLWTKTIGGVNDDEGHSIQQTADGGYIIVGATKSFGAGNSDVYLIKTDASGNTVWTQTFGGSNYDVGHSVQQTSDGGYIITGYYQSSSTGANVYLIKTDSYGDVLWTRTIGGTEYDAGESVRQTIDGGYIIAGSTMSYGAGAIDVFLIRTDSSGDTLWTQTAGGSDSDAGYSVQQTSDEGYIVAGLTNSFSADSIDVFLIKLESETGIEEGAGSNPLFALETIAPNPFTSSLNITCSIPEQARVELAVFDLSGRLVEELMNDELPSGAHTVIWSPAPDLPNGCYLIVLDACGFHTTERCLKLN